MGDPGWPADGGGARGTASLLSALLLVAGACGGSGGPPSDGDRTPSEGGAAAETPAEAPAAQAPPVDGVYGMAPAMVGEVPSVVLLEPTDGELPAPPPGPSEPTIDQLGIQFVPRTLLVQTGTTVRFTNSEAVAHNVTVRAVADGATVFNEDTPPYETLSFFFEKEGGYDVICEVHPGMSSFVFVTSAPFATFAEPDGSFRLGGVPPGTYTLTVWSTDPSLGSERTVVVEDGAPTEVDASPFG